MSALGHAALPSASAQPGLQRAFDAWCSHQRQVGRLRREASISVYQAMWQALAVWCTAQAPPLRPQDLRAPALAAYLASRSGLLLADGVLTPRYQRRLLGLVQRVQAHQAWQQHSEPESFSGATEQRARKASGLGAKRSHSGLWRAFATTTGRLWA